METRGKRNKNPFNIKRSSNMWLGKIPFSNSTDKTFEQFESLDFGLRAGIKLLIKYIRVDKLKTVRDIISRYAPLSENDSEQYIKFVTGYRHVLNGVDYTIYDDRKSIRFPSGQFNTLVMAILDYESDFHITDNDLAYIYKRFNFR